MRLLPRLLSPWLTYSWPQRVSKHDGFCFTTRLWSAQHSDLGWPHFLDDAEKVVADIAAGSAVSSPSAVEKVIADVAAESAVSSPSEAPPELTEPLYFTRMSQFAAAPARATSKSAGYDLRLPEDLTIGPKSLATISVDLVVRIPNGHAGWVAPRSSLSERGLSVESGIVDGDHRKTVRVMLRNHLSHSAFLPRFHSIGQLVLIKIATPIVVEDPYLPEERTSRLGGFGSTGAY